MASGELISVLIKNTIELTCLDSMKKIHSIMRKNLLQVRSKEDNCVTVEE